MATAVAMAFTATLAAGLLSGAAYAQDSSGYATYSNTNGGVCPGSSSGLPGVSMNAAQFGGGSACGQCVQIQGTGSGAGENPVSTAPYIAVITNVCPQCAPGDIDLQESGSGKFGITWSFVACPGSGRKLIEQPQQHSQVDSAEGRAEMAAQQDGQAAEEAVVEQLLDVQAESASTEAQADQTAAAPEETVPGAEEDSSTATSSADGQQARSSRKLLRGL